MEDDLHDQLVKAYLEYFKASEKWEKQDSFRKYYATQKPLRKIRKLALEREKQIREIHYQKQKEAKEYRIKNGKAKNSPV